MHEKKNEKCHGKLIGNYNELKAKLNSGILQHLILSTKLLSRTHVAECLCRLIQRSETNCQIGR